MTPIQTLVIRTTAALSVFLLVTRLVHAQPAVFWEAFNDHRPVDESTNPTNFTSVNATGYNMRVTDDGGVLRNIQTGADLNASLLVVVEGDGTPDDFGANSPVGAGTPADKLFKGFVVIGNDGIPGIRASINTKLILVFNGLNPARRYRFRGTSSRGGNYNDRWSVFSLAGAEAAVDAHQDGSSKKNIFTKATFPASDLQPNQVALNTGDNKDGSLVGWDNIEPGADGSFAVEAQQYTGAAPFGNPSAAAYGYAFSAIYLAEVEATGNLRITENPGDQLVPAGKTATFKVAATSPSAIEYQWQKAVSETAAFVDIPGAAQASYATPSLVAADHGSRFRCRLTSAGITTTSGAATLGVDAVVPAVTASVGSINFNAVYVNFSEAMKLDQLAKTENYEISGGLTLTSAVALDPTHVRLGTTAQIPGTTYSVKVRNVEDVAGNPVPNGTTRDFAGFTVQAGFVGLEVWNGIGGGAVTDLRNDLRYPASPDQDFAIATFNSELAIPNGPNNTYGGRLRAWVTPTETGDYEFFLRGDDQAQLFVGVDDKFEGFENPDRIPDAADTSAGDTFQEAGIDLSTTIPITLQKGRRYALQALWKESNGNDYCQVAWRKVGDATPADQLQPIDSKFLSYHGPTAVVIAPPSIGGITRQNNTVTIEWTGRTLQSSADLVTWADESGAARPFSTPAEGRKFFRAKN